MKTNKKVHGALKIILCVVCMAILYCLVSYIVNSIAISGEGSLNRTYILYIEGIIIGFVLGVTLGLKNFILTIRKKGETVLSSVNIVLCLMILAFLVYKNIPALMFPYGLLFSSSVMDYFLAVTAGFCAVNMIKTK